MASEAFPVGQHALLDVFGGERLGDSAFLESAMRNAAAKAGARIVGAHFHHFGEGQGVTGVLMLAESHISVHTWPERDYAAFDIFMCGAADIDAAITSIEAAFPGGQINARKLARGEA